MKAKRIFHSRLTKLLLIVVLLFSTKLQSQNNCAVPKVLGLGFSASISEVTLNEDLTYTVVIQVRNNGAPYDPSESLNHFSIEANPGTYSDISYQPIYGEVSYNGINYGPNLGGWDKFGFRISSINGIGGGQAGIFSITFTLTEIREEGHYVMAKAGGSQLEAFFSRSEFDLIMDCDVAGVYAMPAGGKISSFLNKIGPELTALSEFNGIPYTNDVYQIVYEESTGIYYVVAEFTPEPEEGQYNNLLNSLLNNHGLREYIEGETISGQIPISELRSINELPSLQSALPVYPVTTNAGLLATSQGDISMISNIARDVFKELIDNDARRSIDGKDVAVGVISNSYDTKPSDVNGASYDVLNWELPGSGNPVNNTDVVVLKEYPYGEASDEGRAMMQIVHDVAPGADLYFRTGVLGAADMAAGIHDLAAVCDIIVDDITYVTEPFFEDGVVAQAVNDVVEDYDVKYFTSAGNFGSKSYTAAFNESSDTFEDFQGYLHDFNPDPAVEDVYQQVTANVPEGANLPVYYTIVLQWNDGTSFEATQTDLDIYLVNNDGVKMIGCNKDNIGGKAIEVLPFAITQTLNTNIVIAKTSGNIADVSFKYIVFKGLLDIDAEDTLDNSTIVGHANTAGAMTVGAIRYDKTPAYNNPLEIMSYSSVGKPWVEGAINKPDFTAPNGVNTTVDLGNGDWDGDEDELPNFFGTSAAAPHAAAVAALLLDAHRAYYGGNMTAEDVKSNLSTSAITEPVSEPSVYGNGFIQADRALMLLGNPAPILYELDLLYDDSIPGIDIVEIVISGDYFISGDDEIAGTILYFNNEPVEVFEVDDLNNTIIATIPPFTALYPPITAENPPKEGSNGKDGGMSNALYFTDKPTIVGSFEGATKPYGWDLPAAGLTYEVLYFGDPTSYSLEEVFDVGDPYIDRIHDIELMNNADPMANAGIWPYYIDPHDWLNPEYIEPEGGDEGPDDDEAYLLANFNFRFELGDLKIEKLDMTVAADNLELDYGDTISGITVTFNYDSEEISPENNDIIQEELQEAYESDVITDLVAVIDAEYMSDGEGGQVPNSYFMSENAYSNFTNASQSLALVNGKALALVNGKALALVNGLSLALVNDDELSELNAQALALVNGKALALVNQQSLALVNINGQALALVNNDILNPIDPGLATDAFVNGEALALVNTEAVTNGKALALVNEPGYVEGLVNGQALALVNTFSFSDVTNDSAIIILTVDDIIRMNTYGGDAVELISVNTVSDSSLTVNSDPHIIAPGAFMASNFNVSYELGELTIGKADLTVTADNQVINEGEPAPEDYVFGYDGLAYEETVEQVFGSDPPAYNILSTLTQEPYNTESPPGDYKLAFGELDNYNVISSIHLFVNPGGPGTKAVVPKLDCVTDNGDETFTAYFMYENRNDETVWVLVGSPDNIVTGGGDPDLSQQPYEFVPGGGYWAADFDGSQMVWTVASQDNGHKTAKAQEASSDSRHCTDGRSVEAGLDEESESEVMLFYPNPVIEKLIIRSDNTASMKGVELYHIYGTTRVTIENETPGNLLEVDMSDMPSGMYILRLKLNESIKTYKILKR